MHHSFQLALMFACACLAGLSSTASAQSPASFREPLQELVSRSKSAPQLDRQIRRQQQSAQTDQHRQAFLTIESITAARTRPGGTTWERGCWIAEPDLKVITIKEGRHNQRHATATVNNVYSATLQSPVFHVEEGDILHFWVYDDDCMFDDKIGDLRVKATDSLLASGQAEFAFGQVLSLKVRFAAKSK